MKPSLYRFIGAVQASQNRDGLVWIRSQELQLPEGTVSIHDHLRIQGKPWLYMLTIVSIAFLNMASSNTKYVVREKGSPLVATTTAKPTIIEPTEVMICLKAIAINPADCKMIYQGHRVTSWPFVPGLDGAGVVEAVGDEVKNFAVGDQVLAMFTASDRAGSYQNFAVVEEMMVAKKPITWSFEDAATLACVVLFPSPSPIRISSVSRPKVLTCV